MNTSYVIELLEEISRVMEENRDRLIELDSAAGDGDLGLTMTKGFRAAWETAKTSSDKDAGRLLYHAGKAMSAAAPSTMGTLMAIGLMQGGKALKGKTELTNQDIADFLRAYEEAIMARGKAKLGEKTFLDGFDPGVRAFSQALDAGESLGTAGERAVSASEEGFRAAASMLAVHGKPAVKGEASRGMEDPGAAVAVLIMRAVAAVSR